MKIRIRGNSIRIRLSQSEVKALAEGRLIENKLDFPGGNSLYFELTTDDGYRATFEEETITICLPQEECTKWVSSEELSLSHDMLISDEESLWLLIEKDLECKSDRPREDDSDAFPNPIKENC